MIQNHGSLTSLSSSKYSDFAVNWPSPYPPPCPKHRLLSAFACLCLVNFISAIDGTVLVGSLSIISKDLQASTTEAFWIGTSFLLASAIFQPLWTALADILGAIPLILSALAFFTLGSSLAPMASSTALILAARTIQGVGGGGIVALTYIITASLVSLQERGKWFGLISLQWAIGSTVGPLMGGAIAENSDWRWIFWLNLPFCVVGFVFIPIVLLNFSGTPSYSWKKLRHLDWLGAVILLCSITSCLIPLTLAGVSFAWLSMEILLPLGTGIVALAFFTIYTIRYSKNQFIRLSLLSSSSAAAAYLGAFIHGMLTYSLLYYLPLYFQVARDYSATISGIALLPWTITVGSAALIIGLLISRKGKYSYFIWFGWVATTAGISLLLSLQKDTPLSVWIVSSIIGGLGLGVTWSATSFASQAAASDDDKPLAGAMFSFVRSIGQAVGVAVSGTIFQNVFRHSIETQKKYAQHASAWTRDSVRVFAALSNSSGPIARDMKDVVVAAHMDALWAIWLVMTILAAVAGLVNMIWLRDPRRRPVIRHIPNETLTQDKESAPFRYEFEGGHVAGAINLHNEDLIDSWLLTAKQGTQQIVVLHCEHSAFRAPKMAQYIRSKDRAMNLQAYPRLTYPSLYILDGGYSKFFSQYPEKCSPQGYVKMDDESHHVSFNMEKYRIQRAKSSWGRRWTRFGQKRTLRPIPLQIKRTSAGK
ncbi:hypothetical protein BFJ70_g17400 [Fusarium oxysporum]|nr:hypothetical protein BFJ70_g17400 [Fusarium oxysporum]